MFILYAVIIGIILGYAAKGRLKNIASKPLRWKYLPLAALLVQLVIFSDLSVVKDMPSIITAALHIASYACLLIFAVKNIRNAGIAMIGSGIFLNSLVIFLNDGFMPTSPENLKSTSVGSSADLIAGGEAVNNSIKLTAETALPWLGDIFRMPSWMPLSNVFSIGDVLIAAGICVYLVISMRPIRKTQSE